MPALFFDAYTRFGPKPSQHPKQPYTLEQIVGEMRHCSISGGLVASMAQTAYDAMLENRRLVEKLRPYDFLFPIWNALPHWTGEFPEPTELTRLMRDADVRAVALNPVANGWRVTSRTSWPLLEELERTQTLTIVDLVTEITDVELEQIAERHPGLQLLLHGASWAKQRFIYPLLLRYKSLHIAFDTFQVNYGLEWLVEQGCEDQLVFASNAADMSMGAHRCYVDYADVSDVVREKVASGNLIRLLKGQRPPREIVNGDEDEIMRAARRGQPVPTHALDIHCHILDEGLNGAGGAGYTMFKGGPAGTWALAQRMGVKGLGLMSWNGPVGVHADDGNACTKAALDALPDTCWGLITCDPIHETREQTRAKLEKWFEDPRFLGLKPYPYFGKQYDDPAYEVWWEFGNERGLYAGIHANRGDFSEFDVLCPKYPKLTWIAYHCGTSYAVADAAIDKAKKYPNFMAEITLTPVCLGIIDYLVAGCGADRVMYGSDLPMRDPRQQFGWVVFSRLPLEQKRAVLGGNAQRLIDGIRAFQRQRMQPTATESAMKAVPA